MSALVLVGTLGEPTDIEKQRKPYHKEYLQRSAPGSCRFDSFGGIVIDE